MSDFIVPPELFTKFNGIKFHDDIHKYYLGDKNLISVTTLLHRYEEKFDDVYWSDIKAAEYGMDQIDVINMWSAWNLKSTVKGSAIHNYAELKFNNKVYSFTQEDIDRKIPIKYQEILKTYPEIYKENVASGIMKKMEGYTILEEYNIVKGYVDNFYNDSYGILIPIKAEYIMYDELWGLAGMLDIIFWNTKHKCFQIWDWKTNKKFDMAAEEGPYPQKLKFQLNDLDACHFNMYSLQLSAYKRILTRNIDIKIEGMYVVHLNEKNPNYKVIKLNDYSNKIDELMVEYTAKTA